MAASFSDKFSHLSEHRARELLIGKGFTEVRKRHNQRPACSHVIYDQLCDRVGAFF